MKLQRRSLQQTQNENMEDAFASSPPAYEKEVTGKEPQASSSRRPQALPQPVTYTVAITSKAIRTFASPDLSVRLVEAYNAFDPSTPQSAIRVITYLLNGAKGNEFHAGRKDEMNYRYVRITVEVPVGNTGPLTVDRKRELLTRIGTCVHEYAGRRANETEVNVVIKEIDMENELWSNFNHGGL